MRQSLLITSALMVCVYGAQAQPSASTKAKAPAAVLTRSAPAVQPQVYRLPRELTGADAHPFATQFYGVSKAKKPKPATKKPARAAEPRAGSI